MSELRNILVTYFSENEIRTLCADLRVDYDDLPGATKTDKAREMIAYLGVGLWTIVALTGASPELT